MQFKAVFEGGRDKKFEKLHVEIKNMYEAQQDFLYSYKKKRVVEKWVLLENEN